mgnify:CR=1 FL=1
MTEKEIRKAYKDNMIFTLDRLKLLHGEDRRSLLFEWLEVLGFDPENEEVLFCPKFENYKSPDIIYYFRHLSLIQAVIEENYDIQF